ncbi:uncharacterized protein isoform X2 [Danio rerio]|uniref:Uncharacterized protein isoform X2 n=1 Tax=Danio rerio TaxID=7955 RepID=A0AB32T4S9_DANRE
MGGDPARRLGTWSYGRDRRNLEEQKRGILCLPHHCRLMAADEWAALCSAGAERSLGFGLRALPPPEAGLDRGQGASSVSTLSQHTNAG